MVVSSLGSSAKFTPLDVLESPPVAPVVPFPASLLDAVGGSVAVPPAAHRRLRVRVGRGRDGADGLSSSCRSWNACGCCSTTRFPSSGA